MPDWKRYVRERLSLDTVKPGRAADIVEDLAGQLQDLYDEAVARGDTPADAEAWAAGQVTDWDRFASDLAAASRRDAPAALDRLADRADVAAARGTRARAALAGLGGDLVHAVRLARRSPGTIAVAVVTLALGIGANTALFSVVRGTLMRPLPFQQEDRLVRLYASLARRGLRQVNMSYPDVLDVAAASTRLEGLSAFSTTTVNLAGGDRPERLEAGYVAPGFFEVLRLAPIAGRTIDKADQTLTDQRVALLAERLWRRRFASDPSILGHDVRLDGRPYTVVGIVPDVVDLPEVWIPLPRSPGVLRRNNRFLVAVGRLRPDASLAGLSGELRGLAANLERAHPATNDGYGLTAESLRAALAGDATLVLWLLQAVVGLVLVVACANVANLLLARASARRQELAIRAALGAGRARLVRQLLVESLLLAGVGGGLGLVGAWWGVPLLVAWAPPGAIRPGTVHLDAGVLLFTLGVSLATGLLAGVAPALLARRTPLRAPLEQGHLAVSGPGGGRLRSALAVVQIAVALVLLAGAALLLQGLAALQADPGYDPHQVLTVPLTLPRARYADDAVAVDFYRRLAARVRRIPGVEGAAVTSMTFTSRSRLLRGYVRDGDPLPGRDDTPSALYYATSPSFLKVMRVPLRDGRYFTGADDGAAAKVAIVSESLARRLWPGDRAVGRRIRVHTDEPFAREVVGVVADTSQGRPGGFTPPQIYVPDAQSVWLDVSLVVRDSLDPNRLRALVPPAVWDLDPDLPVADMATVDDQIDALMENVRVPTMLLTLFSAVGLLMAALGVYGVVSFAAVQRMREFGVRRALGAGRGDIVWLVLAQGGRIAALGLAIGLAVAVLAGRVVASALLHVQPLGAASIAAVAAVAAAAAFVASWLPARRAVRSDPMDTLRV
jgi:putative ABC transport system permease protein